MTTAATTTTTATSTEDRVSSQLSNKGIYELMNSVGVTVKAVVLKSDGSSAEVDYNSTPKANHAQELVNGLSPTIIGEYEDINVILVRGRLLAPNTDLPVNQHELRFPFAHLNGTIHGDIFCYRLSESAQHQSFTLKEYQEFVATPLDPQKVEELQHAIDQRIEYNKSQSKAGHDYDEEQEAQDHEEAAANNTHTHTHGTNVRAVVEEDHDEDEEEKQETTDEFTMDAEFIRSVIVNKIKKDFPLKFNRQPNEAEIQDFYEATLQAFTRNFGSSGLSSDLISAATNAPATSNTSTTAVNGDSDYDPTVDEAQLRRDAAEAKEDEDGHQEEQEREDSEFAKEFEEAIVNIQNLDIQDRQQILDEARKMYISETGNEPSQSQLADAFSLMHMSTVPLSESELRSQLASDLRRSTKPKVELGFNICQSFEEINGRQPNETELQQIFDHITTHLQSDAQQREQRKRQQQKVTGTPKRKQRRSARLQQKKQQRQAATQRKAAVRTVSPAPAQQLPQQTVTYLQSVFADAASQSDALPTVVLRAAQKVVLQQLRLQSIEDFSSTADEQKEELTAVQLHDSVVNLAAQMFGNLSTDDLMLVTDEYNKSPVSSVSEAAEPSFVVDTSAPIVEEEPEEEPEEVVETETVIKHVKTLTTPVKSKANSKRLDIYFEKPQSKQQLAAANQQAIKLKQRQSTESFFDEFFQVDSNLKVTEMDVEYQQVIRSSKHSKLSAANADADDEKHEVAPKYDISNSALAATVTVG